MKNTTLCYIDNGSSYLMLHRIKKKNDQSHDKWLGIGGHFEDGETPHECILRETKEETGLTLTEYRYRGIVTFVSDEWETEYMHLFTATKTEGEMTDCNEGTLEWVPKSEVMNLKLWEGDRIFLKRLMSDDMEFFSLKLVYKGEDLIESKFE